MRVHTKPQQPAPTTPVVDEFEAAQEASAATATAVPEGAAAAAGPAEVPTENGAQSSDPAGGEQDPEKVRAEAEKLAADKARRSAAISESWKNPETHAKRSAHHTVIVEGVEYRSLRKAFEELGLPDKQHEVFRAELKKLGVGGTKDYTKDDGTVITFELGERKVKKEKKPKKAKTETAEQPSA